MDHHCDNLKENIKKSFIIVLAIVLFLEVGQVKSWIKGIFRIAEPNKNTMLGWNLSDISQQYIVFREYALIYLSFCIIFYILINLYLLVRNFYNKSNYSDLNSFEGSLYKYIEDRPSGKAYLVTGEWGSGKTYIVSQFLHKFYYFSKKPIYRISCFGLDSRKLMLEEIKNQIEINDKSFFNWIQYIPLIGKPLFAILKESYSLKSIPKGSIFIFDDFERITSLGITDNKTEGYKKTSSLLRYSGYNRNSQSQEFEDINNEFSKIENALNKYSRENELFTLNNNLQKYNTATGLINELIENYNIKVIIVCNVDILGYDFVDKVFRGKLDCITYNKSIDGNSIRNIFESAFKSQIFSEKDVENLVGNVTGKLIQDFENVWYSSGNSNLRQAKSVFQSFLDSVNVICSKVTIEEDYLVSLFYSIYLVRVLRDDNRLGAMNKFLVGGSLAFFLQLYREKELYNSLKLSGHFNDLKWTGISLAGFWILNMQKPDNITELVNYYFEYEYNNLEIELIKNTEFSWQGERLLVEHAVYEMTTIPREDREKHDKYLETINPKINTILEDSQHDGVSIEEKVRKILTKLDSTLGGRYYPEFLEEWYKSIYLYSKVEALIENPQIYTFEAYNKFVQEKKKEENLTVE